MEYNDIYDKNRKLTGRTHLRGTPWQKGEYGLVACVWVHDGHGHLLLTKRAPEKSFPGTWENSGGAVQAGETSLQAIKRELFEETGIQASDGEFELIDSGMDGNTHFDYYCLKRNCPIEKIVLLPGETVDVMWASFDKVHQLIRQKKICYVIARQFHRQEALLRAKQSKEVHHD